MKCKAKQKDNDDSVFVVRMRTLCYIQITLSKSQIMFWFWYFEMAVIGAEWNIRAKRPNRSDMWHTMIFAWICKSDGDVHKKGSDSESSFCELFFFFLHYYGALTLCGIQLFFFISELAKDTAGWMDAMLLQSGVQNDY